MSRRTHSKEHPTCSDWCWGPRSGIGSDSCHRCVTLGCAPWVAFCFLTAWWLSVQAPAASAHPAAPKPLSSAPPEPGGFRTWGGFLGYFFFFFFGLGVRMLRGVGPVPSSASPRGPQAAPPAAVAERPRAAARLRSAPLPPLRRRNTASTSHTRGGRGWPLPSAPWRRMLAVGWKHRARLAVRRWLGTVTPGSSPLHPRPPAHPEPLTAAALPRPPAESATRGPAEAPRIAGAASGRAPRWEGASAGAEWEGGCSPSACGAGMCPGPGCRHCAGRVRG